MPISYQPYLPDQDFLLPHSMREWLTGSIIVMDNATFHKSPLTRQLIEQVGCELLYFPTYSPYRDPIEKMWGNLKQQWRYKGGSLDDLILESNYLKD